MWKLPDGRILRSSRNFVLGDKQYPAQVLRLWSKAELNAIGVYPYRETSFNRRWYKSSGSTEEVVDGEVVKSYTTVKKYTNAEAKGIRIKEVKNQFKNMIQQAKREIDFAQATENLAEEQEWTDYMAALIAKAKQIRDAVGNINTYSEIISRKVTWPASPEDVGGVI